MSVPFRHDVHDGEPGHIGNQDTLNIFLKHQFYYEIWGREHYFYITTQIYHGAKARVLHELLR